MGLLWLRRSDIGSFYFSTGIYFNEEMGVFWWDSSDTFSFGLRGPTSPCLDSLLLAYTMPLILAYEQGKRLGGAVHSGQNSINERITVVTVTYNSASLIRNLFTNLENIKTIIVVDNASTDQSIDEVRNVVPHARIIINKRNEGFGRAVNRALNEVSTEFALLVSPDCLVDDTVIGQLMLVADRWDNAALVSPSLIDGDGNSSRSHDKDLFSREGMQRNRADEPFPSGDLCAGFVQNATSLVRMRAIKEVGFYDENIFLFYEDDDLCIRLRDKGWSLILAAGVSVRHFSGMSSSLSPQFLTWRRYYHMAWSRAYLEEKYRGQSRGRLLGVVRLGIFFSKLFFAALLLNKWKITRDGARLMGTIRYLFGVSAHSPEERSK